MAENESLIKFPCAFPIKVMGKASLEFEALALSIIRESVPDLGEGAIKSRHSKDGNFVSVTATINATSQDQLDTIYRALHAHDDVLVVF